MYASEASTVDDIEAARQALAQALSDTKKTAKPVDGQCFDMTEFLVNPSFESGKAGWLLDKQTGGWESFDTWNDRPAHEGSYFISLAYGSITSIDLYQVVEGLPCRGVLRAGCFAQHRRGGLADRPTYLRRGTSRYIRLRSPVPRGRREQ